MLYVIRCEHNDVIDYVFEPLSLRNDIRIMDASSVHGDFRIGLSDKLLFLGFMNPKQQRALMKEAGCNEAKAFVWESVSKHYNSSRHKSLYDNTKSRYGIEYHTLDIKDAAEYGFLLVEPVYRYGENNKCKEEMSPNNYLEEHLGDEDTAWTPRTLEALFNNKKLVSNNRCLLEAPFYDSHNIYIVGEDDKWRTLDDFLREPYIEVAEEKKAPYEIGNWINKYI